MKPFRAYVRRCGIFRYLGLPIVAAKWAEMEVKKYRWLFNAFKLFLFLFLRAGNVLFRRVQVLTLLEDCWEFR